MQKSLLTFSIKLLIFSLIAWALFFFLRSVIPVKFLYHHIEYLVGLFFIITLAFHTGMLKNAQNGNRKVVIYFMMATGIKLFLYVGVIVVYSILKTGHLVAFVTTFLMLYMLYTIFEAATVYFLFKSGESRDTNGEP